VLDVLAEHDHGQPGGREGRGVADRCGDLEPESSEQADRPSRSRTALAGLALTAATGLGPLLRMAAASDGPRVAAWAAGALLPSLALLLGSASRSSRLFQALYVALWYAAVNQLAPADYMGTVLAHGRPAGPSALLVAGIAIAMLAVTFGIGAVRHATR
jgi:hypothetical protein